MLPESFTDSTAYALLFALGIVVLFCAAGYLGNFIIGQALKIIVGRHESPLRSIEIRLIGALRIPFVLAISVYGIRLALTSLSQASTASLGFVSSLGQLGNIAWVVSVAAIACYTISRLINAGMRWYSARSPQETRTALNITVWPILIRISAIFVYAIGALVVLDILGIPITPLLAGLGIGGLAVALAVSPTIASFIAGTYVVAEGNISEGDYVEIDTERAGFVESIGWRSTVLRSRFNNLIVVPNNMITDSILTNYATPTPAVTGIVECGVSYDSDLREVERVCLDVAGDVVENSDDANKDFEPRVRFAEFADSNINFRVIYQGVDRTAMLTMKHEIIMRLHARFREEGIVINYPVRTLTSAFPADYLPDAADTNGRRDNVHGAVEDSAALAEYAQDNASDKPQA